MRSIPQVPRYSWSPEQFLEQAGCFYFDESKKILDLPLSILTTAKTMDIGVMMQRGLWVINMPKFKNYYLRNHHYTIRHIPAGATLETLMEADEVYRLKDLLGHIHFSGAHTNIISSIDERTSRREHGIWFNIRKQEYLVTINTFGPWLMTFMQQEEVLN
jgi:hypothetical protein